MNRETIRGRTRLLATSLTALLALCTVSVCWAGETPLASIQGKLEEMTAELHNTTVKLKHLSGGGSMDRTGALSKARPGTMTRTVNQCCARNVRVITEHLDAILTSMRELHSRAARDENQPALEALSLMAQRYKFMAEAFDAFTETADKVNAKGALRSLKAEFHRFSDATAEYDACCSRKDSKAGNKKKKKKKSKKPAETS